MLIRWDSSSEGSNRRCQSLAANALIAAANSIQTLISIRFGLRYIFSAWFALIVVLNRTTQTVAIVLITARYANNLGIVANSAFATSAEHQDTKHPNVLYAANAAARPS
jgi:hypothetical protein